MQLQVLNLNDEIPVFTASHYSVSISETAPPGAIISTDVFATDPDQVKLIESINHWSLIALLLFSLVLWCTVLQKIAATS